MNADGSGTRKLTHNARDNAEPAWSPDGRKIAFRSTRNGNRDIYVMNADGSGKRNLTRNAAWDSRPSWSPDGRKIAFVSDRDGRLEAHVMNADGSGQRSLTRPGEMSEVAARASCRSTHSQDKSRTRRSRQASCPYRPLVGRLGSWQRSPGAGCASWKRQGVRASPHPAPRSPSSLRISLLRPPSPRGDGVPSCGQTRSRGAPRCRRPRSLSLPSLSVGRRDRRGSRTCVWAHIGGLLRGVTVLERNKGRDTQESRRRSWCFVLARPGRTRTRRREEEEYRVPPSVPGRGCVRAIYEVRYSSAREGNLAGSRHPDPLLLRDHSGFSW